MDLSAPSSVQDSSSSSMNANCGANNGSNATKMTLDSPTENESNEKSEELKSAPINIAGAGTRNG